MKKLIIKILFFSGAALLGMNISGFFIPLKHPEIYHEKKTGFENDTTLTPEETFDLLRSLDGNDKKHFATAANSIFNRSIAHY